MYTKFLILLFLLHNTACTTLITDHRTSIKEDIYKIYSHVNNKKCYSHENPCEEDGFIFYSTGNLVLITPNEEQITIYNKQLIQFSRKFPEHETFFYSNYSIEKSGNYEILRSRNIEIRKAINSLTIML
jgi:hypothetical protein